MAGAVSRKHGLEDYVVSGLVDFDDVAYDDHADLLYDLAGQMVRHFSNYLSEDETQECPELLSAGICRVHPCADAGPLLGGGVRLRGEGQ